MITAVILAKNEEENISTCIDSLSFVNEIIVIDDFSSDKTAELAKKKGAVVIKHPLNNDFSQSRNFGMKIAKNDWILFLDADELISDKLQKSILEAVTDTTYTSYFLPRRDFFWGKELQYGETVTARRTGINRLMKKGSGEWKGSVHEIFMSTGKSKTLKGFINHYPHQTIITFLHSINDYSSKRAEELNAMGVKQNPLSIFLFPLGKFLYTYFIKLGFLDGPSGFVYCLMMSFHSFLVRGKLYIHQKTGEPFFSP